MKIAIYFFVALVAVSAPTVTSAEGQSVPRPIRKLETAVLAPQTTFLDEQGSIKTLLDFEGKIVVVNFWATWCSPCIKEMPSLERLSLKLPSRDFAVIAISQDEGGAAVAKPFLERIQVNQLAIYYDPNGQLSREFGVRGFPTTVILAKDGTVNSKLEGVAEWDADNIVAYLRSIL
jgi:thiol-disulfide isomerase/thioredoxin